MLLLKKNIEVAIFFLEFFFFFFKFLEKLRIKIYYKFYLFVFYSVAPLFFSVIVVAGSSLVICLAQQ